MIQKQFVLFIMTASIFASCTVHSAQSNVQEQLSKLGYVFKATNIPLKTMIFKEITDQAGPNQITILETLKAAEALLILNASTEILHELYLDPMLFNRTPRLLAQLRTTLKYDEQPSTTAASRPQTQEEKDIAQAKAASLQEAAQKKLAVEELPLPKDTWVAEVQPGIKLNPKITRIHVLGQKDEYCGFHTVLNALWAEQVLQGKITDDEMRKKIALEENQKQIETLRSSVLKKAEEFLAQLPSESKKEWEKEVISSTGALGRTEIEYLMDQYQLNPIGAITPLTKPQITIRKTDPHLSWTIVERIFESPDITVQASYGAAIPTVLRKLRTDPNASHIFLLCNVTPERKFGHWISVIVRNDSKTKTRHYIVQDSLNQGYVEMIYALMKFIDTANIEQVEKQLALKMANN